MRRLPPRHAVHTSAHVRRACGEEVTRTTAVRAAGRLLSRVLDFFLTCRRVSRMPGGSYLPANDWCAKHHQSSSSTLTFLDGLPLPPN